MSQRVTSTLGAIYSTPRRSRRRRRCDGHLTDRHYIEIGDLLVWSALPPHSEIGNERWWHSALCSECWPESSGGDLDEGSGKTAEKPAVGSGGER